MKFSSVRYIAILALVLLTGCAAFSKKTPDFSCPQTGFIADADVVSFPGVKAEINGFNGDCRPVRKPHAVRLNLTLPFIAKKDAAAPATLKEQELRYFIAVLSPQEGVLQRRAFTTKISFDETGGGLSTEEHVVTIPLPEGAEAYKYKVAFGFELTPAQLRLNKNQGRDAPEQTKKNKERK